jgi:hypothetical protein
MKIFKLLLAGFVITVPFACKKSTSDCSLVPAKVIRYDCDRVILQLMTSQPIGDNQWTDVFTGNTYQNVVSYYNTCQVSTITNGELVTIYVKPELTQQDLSLPDCYQCQAISNNPPQTKVLLTEIQEVPCNME